MPYLRFSRAAREQYTCARCSRTIPRRQPYFRDEPHPFARMRDPDVAFARQLCLSCAVGQQHAQQVFRALSARASHPGQLSLGFSLTRNGFLRFPPRVESVDITPQLLNVLAAEPSLIRSLSPDAFELLICDRLNYFGYDFARVGHSYRKDGGIDLVAWQRTAIIPVLIAVQAKHTSNADKRIGPGPVRDLAGTVHRHGLSAGLLVTNTRFSPDAEWFARKQPLIVQLRDIEDLRRWLQGEFSVEDEWREIPIAIELCPGVTVQLPR